MQTPKLGERICECAACHRYFTSTGTFDKHRTWNDDRRECVDPSTVGLEQRANGMWGGPHMTPEQLAALRGVA